MGGSLAVTINALRLARVGGRRVKLRRLPESLVACRQGTGYALRMSSRTHIVLAAAVGRLTRMSMLVLGVLSVPSVGPAAMQRPHCAQHDPSAVHQGAHSGTHQVPASNDATSWDSATQHECPHCPATECARVAPCTVASNAAISEVSVTVPNLVADLVGVRRMRVHPHSAAHQPPTPPPQLIS